MFILIPVYREQSVIQQALNQFQYFSANRPWLHIIFVTSIREDLSCQELTTHDILENLIMQIPDRRIRLIKCNNKSGVMAHQLNYAIEQLIEEESIPFHIGIYNVDSILSPFTIDYVHCRLIKNHDNVFQQYAVYPTEYTPNIKGRVLCHIAGWQTRWSLHFELGRLLVDNRYYTNIFHSSKVYDLIRPFHYTIGHGLFFTSSTFVVTTGFAEDEINEDAQFGLIINLLNRQIEPIPYLEVAAPPPTLSVYFKQQSVWFNGPVYAFRYAKKIFFGSKGRHLKRPIANNYIQRISIIIMAAKLFMHALYWILGPPIILFLTIWILVTQSLIICVAWIVLTLYFVWGLNGISHLVAFKHSEIYSQRAKVNLFYYPLAAFIAYLFHCVGPILCLYKIITGKNIHINKYKTERSKST